MTPARTLLYFFLLFFSIIAAPAFSQSENVSEPEAPEEPPTANEEEDADLSYTAVVVGSRVPGIALPLPRATSVTSKEMLMAHPGASVGDLLESTLGINNQSTNRGASAPIIRGHIGAGNLIVFDGVRFNTGTFRTGPNQYLNLFDPYSLDSIEILRGAGGVLYGSDTIGGVFHLRPLSLRYNRGFSLIGLNRYQTADNSETSAFSVSYSNSQWSLEGGPSLSWFNTLRAGEGGLVPASDYSQYSGHLQLGYLPRPETEVQFKLFSTSVLDAGRTDQLYRSNFRSYDNHNFLGYFRLDHLGSSETEIGTIERTIVSTFSANYLVENQIRHQCAQEELSPIPEMESHSISASPVGCITGEYTAIDEIRLLSDDVFTLGMSLVVESVVSRWSFLRHQWGVDASESWIFSERTDRFKPEESASAQPEAFLSLTQPRGNFSDGSRYGQMGIFERLLFDFSFGDGWTFLPSIGGRLSHISAHAPNVPDLGEVNYRYLGLAGESRLGLQRDDLLLLYLGWSQGFRAPNLQETTVLENTGSFFEIPNENLRPEFSNEFETGLQVTTENLSLELNTFYAQIDGIITREEALYNGESAVDGAAVMRRVNAESGRYLGAEGGISFLLPGNLTLIGQVQWVDGEITEQGIASPARRVPPLRWMSKMRYDYLPSAFFLAFGVTGAGDQNDLNSEDLSDLRICGSTQYPGLLLEEIGEHCQGTPGWFTLNASAGLEILENITFMLSLNNLLDARYRLHGSGLDSPGFNGSITFELEI
jgi:hypothetical protein